MLAPTSSAYEPPPVKHKPLVFEYSQSTPEQLAALAPEELWRREQDLFRRERETAEREEELFAQWSKGGRLPNWPPFWPVIHQNIIADVHTYYAQYTVMLAYYSWCGVFPALVFNVFCMVATLAINGKDYIPDVILSFCYLVIGPLLTLIFYRIYYKAARKKKLYLYLTWYVLIAHEIAVLLLFAAAPRGCGAAGIITAYKNFDAGYNGVGTICIVQVVLWAALTLCLIGVGGLSVSFCQEKKFSLDTNNKAKGQDPQAPRLPQGRSMPKPADDDAIDVIALAKPTMTAEEEEEIEINASEGGFMSALSPANWSIFKRKVEEL